MSKIYVRDNIFSRAIMTISDARKDEIVAWINGLPAEQQLMVMQLRVATNPRLSESYCPDPIIKADNYDDDGPGWGTGI